MSYFIIYKTTNLVNNKIYIGAHETNNLNDNYLGSGKYLKSAIKKYGVNSFVKEILFIYNNREQMFSKEAELVTEEFCKRNDTYNIKVGGFGGWNHVSWKGKKRSKENKQKQSLAMKDKIGNKNSFYGKHHKIETKNTLSKIGIQIGKERYKNTENHINKKISSCPHCNKRGQERAMKRWHFDNCKLNTI